MNRPKRVLSFLAGRSSINVEPIEDNGPFRLSVSLTFLFLFLFLVTGQVCALSYSIHCWEMMIQTFMSNVPPCPYITSTRVHLISIQLMVGGFPVGLLSLFHITDSMTALICWYVVGVSAFSLEYIFKITPRIKDWMIWGDAYSVTTTTHLLQVTWALLFYLHTSEPTDCEKGGLEHLLRWQSCWVHWRTISSVNVQWMFQNTTLFFERVCDRLPSVDKSTVFYSRK